MPRFFNASIEPIERVINKLLNTIHQRVNFTCSLEDFYVMFAIWGPGNCEQCREFVAASIPRDFRVRFYTFEGLNEFMETFDSRREKAASNAMICMSFDQRQIRAFVVAPDGEKAVPAVFFCFHRHFDKYLLILSVQPLSRITARAWPIYGREQL